MPAKLKKIKEKELDRVFSLWIRNRDKRCLKCGTTQNLQCAHIFSRTARSVRWDPLNALTLCWKDHLTWAHRNPVEFTEFVTFHLGEEKFTELKKRYYSPKQFSDNEKRDLLSKFQL